MNIRSLTDILILGLIWLIMDDYLNIVFKIFDCLIHIANVLLLKERDKAARIIQCAIISFLAKRRLKKRVNAALVIQKYWRRRIAQRKLLTLKKEKLEKVQNNSASVIQV